MSEIETIEQKQLIAKRVPPGDRWALLEEEDKTYESLTDTLEAYFHKTKFTKSVDSIHYYDSVIILECSIISLVYDICVTICSSFSIPIPTIITSIRYNSKFKIVTIIIIILCL